MNYTEYSAQDLRDIIVKAGFAEGENIKGKSNLAEFIEKNNINVEAFIESDGVEFELENENEFYVTVDNEKTEKKEQEKLPEYGTDEWNNYLVGQLRSDEVDLNGHPLLPGLRRLTNILLGEVIFSGPITTSYNIVNRSPEASCVYELQIAWKHGEFYSDPKNWIVKTFRAAGDCFEGNADSPWNLYATAIAESRAEARAYRKALGLKVVTGEEVSKQVSIDREDKITNNQMVLIKQRVLNLKLKEDISEILLGKKLSECSKKDGYQLVKLVNEYNEDINKIPEEVKL